MRYPALIVLALAAAAACNDTAQSAAIVAPAIAVDGGVRAYVVLEPGGSADRTTITVHVDSRKVGIAAYQGRLEFDAGAFDVLDATTPTDGSRLVNAQESAAGIIRFAGYSTDDFASTEAVRLVVRLHRRLDAANLVATLDVAGGATGVAVAKDRIMQQRGIFTSSAAQIQ